MPCHAANLLLYALTAGLVSRIAGRLVAPPGALAAGLVFAVHPVHVEVFANSVGQSELLAALLALLAVERYLAWGESRAGFTPARRLLLAAGYALAVAAKETGYVLPLLLLAAGALAPPPPGKARLRSPGTGSLFFLLGAVMAGSLLIRIILFGGLAGEVPQVPLRSLDSPERFLAMLGVVPEWARLLLWPAQLQAHYGPPGTPVDPVLGIRQAGGLLILVLGGTVFLAARRRAPVLALGLGWVAIALLPVSNLAVATGVLVAERTLFLPSAGLALVAGWAAERLYRAASRDTLRATVAGAGVLLLGVGAGRTLTRIPVWRDPDRFFAHMEQDAPDSYRARLTAGIYYRSRGRSDAARAAFHRAWELYREDPAVFEEYGQLLRTQRRCDLALPILAEGVVRHPEATLARARLIECALVLGDTSRAVRAAREAVALGQTEFQGTLRRLNRSQ